MLPTQDEDVPAFWEGLGLPGLYDVHVHFLPERLQAKVYAQFDAGGEKIGRPWPIRYRGTHAERVEQLRALGVRRFPTLPYAHRPGIAVGLNRWAADFAAEVGEDCLVSGTLYPEEGVADYVRAGLESGVQVWKMHVQVGEFWLDDPLLDEAWGVLADAGSPVVIHAGHGPVGNDFTGAPPLARVLARHPRLTVVAAHMGAPDYRDFVDLALRFERTFLDTTMVFTDFFEEQGPVPLDLGPRLRDLQRQVLLGSDFPTIPYSYAHQLEGIVRYADRAGLDDDWLRDVCWHNGMRLIG